MDDKNAIWHIATLIGLAITAPTVHAVNAPTPVPSTPTQPAANPFPLSSTVSYDSLRIMAYSGQSDQAIKLAQDYLKTHESSAIRVLLARMLAWDKQFDAAREQLLFVLNKHPGDYDASDCLSDVEMWLGNYQRAIDVLTSALKYDPKNEGLLEKREIIRAKMQVSQGHRDQAIQIAEAYLKAHESSLNMRIYLATQLSVNQQYDEARKLLDYVLTQKPSSTDASNELANIEISVGNYSKALEVINDGLKYSPQNADLLQNKQYVTGKFNPSGKPAAITVTAPAQKPSGVTLDELKKMSANGQRKKAIQLAYESLKQNDNSDIRIFLGSMLSWDKRYNEARTQFEIVLKKKPDSLDAEKGLANVELWSGNNKSALIVITNALKHHPLDKDLLKQRNSALGISGITPEQLRKLYTSGQTDKAKELAKETLNRSDNVDIRVLLGLMESWDSQYDDAKIQFETVLKKSPGYSDASLALANVYTYSDNYQAALKVVNAGLKQHPNDANLLKKRADIIQTINQASIVAPGVFSVFNIVNAVGPYSPGQKMNAVLFDQEMSYVDNLKQTWKITSLGYERQTPYGPIIFTFNQTDRFNTAGNQVLVEAYPHLFKGAYMYLGYGYSATPYLARNYIGFEPFFSLPHGFEFSAGERILQFQGGVTHLYTGSFSKYYGNYWFSIRPYYTLDGSRSYYLTARRYFSSPDSYISITAGGGEGPNLLGNLVNPNSLSATQSRSIRLNGDVPLTENLIFTWLVEYSYEHFPNTITQQETDVDAGFIWRF